MSPQCPQHQHPSHVNIELLELNLRKLTYRPQRLAKWFTTLSPKDKAKIVKDVSQLVLARRTRMCNFLEYKGGRALHWARHQLQALGKSN